MTYSQYIMQQCIANGKKKPAEIISFAELEIERLEKELNNKVKEICPKQSELRTLIRQLRGKTVDPVEVANYFAPFSELSLPMKQKIIEIVDIFETNNNLPSSEITNNYFAVKEHSLILKSLVWLNYSKILERHPTHGYFHTGQLWKQRSSILGLENDKKTPSQPPENTSQSELTNDCQPSMIN